MSDAPEEVDEVEAPDLQELAEFLRQVAEERGLEDDPMPRATSWANGHLCTRTTWRGELCCVGSVPRYQQVASTTGSAFYVDPINGSWSDLDASANTHGGGGADDFEGDGYTKDQVYTATRRCRDQGLYAMPRLWVNKDGSRNWHIHTLDANCHTLTSAAKAQFELFEDGYDGLVGNGPDPLGGYRKTEIMRAYRNRNNTVTTTPEPTATSSKVTVKFPSGFYPQDVTTVYGNTSQNAQGKHIYEWQDSAGTWHLVKEAKTNSAGDSTITHSFGGKHPIRVRFVPADTTKFKASTSASIMVDFRRAADVFKALDDLTTRVKTLEAGNP